MGNQRPEKSSSTTAAEAKPYTSAEPRTGYDQGGGTGNGAHRSQVETAEQIERQNKHILLLKGALYHDRREAWFAGCHRWLLFISLILGSSAAADVITGDAISRWFGLGVAVATGLSLVLSLSDKARDHRVLKSRYYNLLKRLENGASLKTINQEELGIFAEEPPMMNAINALAQNEASRSILGNGFYPLLIWPWQIWLGHLIRFRSTDFPSSRPES